MYPILFSEQRLLTFFKQNPILPHPSAEMAGLAVLDIVASLVGVGLMIPGLLPAKDANAPVVRIQAGSPSDITHDLGGDLPGVRLFDVWGRLVGEKKGNKKKEIKTSSFWDITIPFADGVGNPPSEYISVVNGGDDALCIAYVALTQPDDTKKVFYGDFAKECGADWYHSWFKTGDDDYQPACFWIDKNRSNGLRYQGIGLHFNDFAPTEERAKQLNENRDLMCKSKPRLHMYEEMGYETYIPFFNPPLELETKDGSMTDKDPGAVFDESRWAMPEEPKPQEDDEVEIHFPNRFVRRGDGNSGISGSRNFTAVVISTSPRHSAKELCESPTSRGDDFVSSTENLFCDMEMKKLWPVCDTQTTSACFDTTTSTMRPGKGLRGRDSRSGMVPPAKSYTKTVRWG